MTTPLQTTQADHAVWVKYNFGHVQGSDPNDPLLGMMEELGELAHAVLKKKQGIRGTPEQHDAAIKDALGDLMIYTMDFCNRRGLDLQDIVNETWATVKQRDWIKFPKNGLTE